MRWCHLVSVSLGLSSVAAGVTGPPRPANSVTSSFSSTSSSVSSSSSTSTTTPSPFPSCGRVRAVAGRARLCNTVEECGTDCSRQNCTTTSQYRPVKCRAQLARLLAMLSFVKGMSEFLEGEVSLVCRKNILIHGQNPGFYYLQDKRFKWGFSDVLMNTTML